MSSAKLVQIYNLGRASSIFNRGGVMLPMFGAFRQTTAPITLYRIASERHEFCTGLGSCLHYATIIRYVPRKSLGFGGDMKSNPVCAEAV